MGAIIAGAVIAAGATAYAGMEASGAQSDANEANAANAAATNAANLEMFYASRGGGGDGRPAAAILPLYFKKKEKRLARDTSKFYNQLQARRPASEILERAEAAQRMFRPAQLGAEEAAQGIFSGALRDEALANFAPLGDERLQSAEAMRQAGREALAENLSVINRDAARKGFVGDTFQSRLLAGEAMRRSMTDASLRESAAREQNAENVFNIRQNDINRRLGSMNLPYAMARNRIDFQNTPENAALDQAARRQQLFNFFRIGPGQFQYSPMPGVSPVASGGQIAAQALGAAAGSVGNYYANKSLIADMRNNRSPGTSNYYGNSFQTIGGSERTPQAYGDWASDMLGG